MQIVNQSLVDILRAGVNRVVNDSGDLLAANEFLRLLFVAAVDFVQTWKCLSRRSSKFNGFYVTMSDAIRD